MVHGKLEVLLVCAKGLEDTDFMNNMDPYVILTCRTQEQKSSVAKGAGSEPEWNESFIFTVSDDIPEFNVKIMDSDALSADDFVGEATIPLEPVFLEGSLPPAVHRVVKEEKYCGGDQACTHLHSSSGKSPFERGGGLQQLELIYLESVHQQQEIVLKD